MSELVSVLKRSITFQYEWKKPLMILFFFCCIAMMGFVNTRADKSLAFFISFFGSISFLYFLLKMVLAFFYKPATREPVPNQKVSVIIPNFNESADSMVKTVECLLLQDYPVHEIIFVDDGSTDTTGFEAIERMALEMYETQSQVAAHSYESSTNFAPKIITHRFTENKGKRHAQSWGFERATGDFIFIVDSDGYIFPNAVRELLKPFRNNKVLATTGHVNARNLNDSIMTRLQDILYEGAFRVGRGSQSVTNTVLVCSGAISMFRANFVKRNLARFQFQKVFGKNIMIGDDRRLTTMALEEGGIVKYQETAKCITDVPTTLRQFFKQQVRWSKSFYIDSIISLKFAWKKPVMLMWLLGEGLIWILFAVTVGLSWFHSFEVLGSLLFIYSFFYLILSALSKNVFYILKNPLLFIASPFFALIQMMLLFPIRIYSLLTIHKGSWGTR